MSDEELPAFLMVEEAARVLRIGRTKAYAMVTEWRVTDGKSGLPVRDLGGVLRVPLAWVKEMAGGELDPGVVRAALSKPKPTLAPVADDVIDLTDPEPTPAPQPRSTRRARTHQTPQPALFDLPPAS
jgi:hypothetical protein